MQLHTLGFDPMFQSALERLADASLRPARVIAVHRGTFALAGCPGVDAAPIAGRLRRDADELALPAVGDWVAVDPDGRIQHVLPRRTQLVRRAAGAAHVAQVVAANVDSHSVNGSASATPARSGTARHSTRSASPSRHGAAASTRYRSRSCSASTGAGPERVVTP